MGGSSAAHNPRRQHKGNRKGRRHLLTALKKREAEWWRVEALKW
jgi:hypothetical protein